MTRNVVSRLLFDTANNQLVCSNSACQALFTSSYLARVAGTVDRLLAARQTPEDQLAAQRRIQILERELEWRRREKTGQPPPKPPRLRSGDRGGPRRVDLEDTEE